jgi:hypothetical protein
VRDNSIADKADYVRRQGQTRNHTCHWPGCQEQVPPAAWGCKEHWMKLPRYLRLKVWRAFRPGQEKTMDPSAEYIKVAKEVQEWVRSQGYV